MTVVSSITPAIAARRSALLDSAMDMYLQEAGRSSDIFSQAVSDAWKAHEGRLTGASDRLNQARNAVFAGDLDSPGMAPVAAAPEGPAAVQ